MNLKRLSLFALSFASIGLLLGGCSSSPSSSSSSSKRRLLFGLPLIRRNLSFGNRWQRSLKKQNPNITV
ncbi:hypothetical protein, partial [Liquorilactobacillus vini]|uniref:hypothetical protein n=1 Tax=Liquorilactobacillus vini TaxID=238015 RepID=UPI001F16E265